MDSRNIMQFLFSLGEGSGFISSITYTSKKRIFWIPKIYIHNVIAGNPDHTFSNIFLTADKIKEDERTSCTAT